MHPAAWPSLAVVVPVYNEAAAIETSCRTIAEVVGAYAGRACVVAVDDGSADASAEILERLEGELPNLELLRHERNMGYGAALRTGAMHGRRHGFEYVAFIDSDLTNPPADLLKIALAARGGADYIKASRYIPGGAMTGVPWARRLVSRTGNAVARRLFGTPVRDVTNGFRAGRSELLGSWTTREQTFAVIVEEFSYALESGASIAEFPSVLAARTAQQRGTAFAYTAATLWAYLRYPLRYRFRHPRGARRS
jgi:dolichol-phosphate mannosyltransferase